MRTWASSWERVLLERARQAMVGWQPMPIVNEVEPELLPAYQVCADITRQHSRTFYLASGLLPWAKRLAVRALYAFCRVSDEIIDNAGTDPQAELAAWRRRVLLPDVSHPVVRAWTDAQRRYGIPRLYVEQLLDGVAHDLVQTRYETFAQLAEYCYGVACTVGLMSMYIVGFSNLAAVPYAIKLGVALQLTNILRDVAEDWRAGRVYLPREDLDAFGIGEDDIAEGRLTDRWRNMMHFQIARARQFYADAWPGLRMLHPDGRFAIAAAGRLYEAILDDIAAHGYDVFRRRAHVSTVGKLWRLPFIWWLSRRPPAQEPCV